ncbi:MAG: glycosyltransferase family 4 protein, partial [Candidatus Thorarchaeota archaeon]
VHLVVVGKDCERYRRDLGTDARGLSEALHFPGWVEQEDLPAMYSMARAFVFPSVYEEFGIPVVEAMSCGCPVAAANTGALPELSGDAALLCDPFDSEKLAENTLAILLDNDVAETCRQRGLQRAAGFSWNQAARQTLEIFQRTAGG